MYVFTGRARSSMLRILGALMLAVALLGTAFSNVTAQSGEKPGPLPGYEPHSSQIISGNPIKVTVTDNTQIGIEFTNPTLGQDSTPQFYSDFANGVYLWVPMDGVTKVFGPAYVPGGHFANAYQPVSNTMSGTGTPADPWIVTTVNDVPGTKIRLTQTTSYVNGAEYVMLQYALQQMGGVAPIKVALLHAADFSTGRDNEMAYGYFNSHTHGVGDYIYAGTETPAARYYQQFVPLVEPAAHQEGDYAEIWDQIGDISGPGAGFNNICKVDQALDAAIGLQWVLALPTSGTVTVGDVAFFGPHIDLAGSFSDVAFGTFPYEYIYYLGTHHIISGYADGTFRPNNDATRAQLAKMVVLSMNWEVQTPAVGHFKDVPASNPYFGYVETAYSHGIIGGYADGTFRPMNHVTRGQAMKMVVKAAGWPINVAGGPHFSDVPDGSDFYRYIETAFKAGVISGYSDGTFRPMNDMTRAQLSKVLYPLATEFGDSK